MSNTEQFSFSQFKIVMNIAEVDEPTYALLLRAVFKHTFKFYSIDLDDEDAEFPAELVFNIYRHAKYLFDTNKGNLDTVSSVSDSSGNRTSFKGSLPKEITMVYKAYSPEPPAYL